MIKKYLFLLLFLVIVLVCIIYIPLGVRQNLDTTNTVQQHYQQIEDSTRTIEMPGGTGYGDTTNNAEGPSTTWGIGLNITTMYAQPIDNTTVIDEQIDSIPQK